MVDLRPVRQQTHSIYRSSPSLYLYLQTSGSIKFPPVQVLIEDDIDICYESCIPEADIQQTVLKDEHMLFGGDSQKKGKSISIFSFILWFVQILIFTLVCKALHGTDQIRQTLQQPPPPKKKRGQTKKFNSKLQISESIMNLP